MTVIINELLCYMLCKIDIIPIDVLVKLVGENFSDDDVEAAKGILGEHVDESVRTGNRRGQNKKKMNLDDIAKMLIECDRVQLPKFVALDLSKLPPITVDCIDVSALMRKQQLMDIEMSTMKDMIQDILKVTADTSKRVEEAMTSRPIPDNGSQGPSLSVSTSSLPATKMTYANVVQGGSSRPRDGEWVTANRAKRVSRPLPDLLLLQLALLLLMQSLLPASSPCRLLSLPLWLVSRSLAPSGLWRPSEGSPCSCRGSPLGQVRTPSAPMFVNSLVRRR